MAARVLVIGYGNPGRLDDGLGPALAERISALGLEWVTADSDYQLNVEDAREAADHDVVVFADASVNGPEPFHIEKVQPKSALRYSSHSCEPPEVIALARDLFGARLEGYVLGIRGYEFNEFGESISAAARGNLEAAARFLETVLREGSFERVEAGVNAKEWMGSAPPEKG